KLAGRGDVMGLYVEDELAGRLPLVGGRRLDRLDRIDLEERPEHGVQREEGRGHARAGGEELAPGQPEPPRAPSRVVINQRGDAPRALLDAALHIVETQGTGALTLRAAARSAGVSQAAPYRHFTNKEAILAAVAEEGFRSLMTAIRQATAAGDGPLGRLRG